MLSRLLVQLGLMSTKSTTISKARGYNKQHPRRKRVSRIDWFFSLPIPTSFTHFLACVLFSSHALAYRNVQLHHPGNITSCVPVNITWHSGTPPFRLEIIPEYPLSWDVPKTHRDGLHVDHLVENFYLWPPNFPRAWRVRIRVSDRTSTSAMVRGKILENSTGGCTNIVAPPNTTTSIETVTSTLTVSTSTLMLTSTRIGDTSPNGKWKTSMTIAIGAVGMVALSTLLLIFFRCRYLRRHAHDRAHGSGEHNGVWSDWTDYEQEAGGSSDNHGERGTTVTGALLPEEPEPQPRPSLTYTGRLTGRSQAPLPLVRATPLSRLSFTGISQRAGETAAVFRPFVHSRKVVLSAVVEQDESSSIGHHSTVKGVDGSTETLNDSWRTVEDPALEPVDRDAHEHAQDTVTPTPTGPRSSGPYVAVERSDTASSGGTGEILRVLSEVISKDPSRALQYPLQNAGVTGGREGYGSGTSGGRSDTTSSNYADSLAAPSSPDIDPHLTHLTPLTPISSRAVGRRTTFPTTGRSSDFESRLRTAVLSLQRNPSTSSSTVAVAASIRSGSLSSRHASSLGTIPSSPDIDPNLPPGLNPIQALYSSPLTSRSGIMTTQKEAPGTRATSKPFALASSKPGEAAPSSASGSWSGSLASSRVDSLTSAVSSGSDLGPTLRASIPLFPSPPMGRLSAPPPHLFLSPAMRHSETSPPINTEEKPGREAQTLVPSGDAMADTGRVTESPLGNGTFDALPKVGRGDTGHDGSIDERPQGTNNLLGDHVNACRAVV